ncbi:uncharacterized protein CTHT_0017080 [Thermochaetoides thermophila DSM 1495]|uniref:Uncharacterized protein n=1 Tax=Chaetomium thermophilum (strain DSM 1495 / CBS 144.50 / IMI 039719) TaxID=759272 RepID=G0S2F8_CHATD|nr:hypothetical protein CTHT_0017080 [Thermochaetoides thermophila DSM 1495]EGS22191.1 hypothetical protein CTHT_0017080 [Thermochaetoides thermophila DSM 1495]
MTSGQPVDQSIKQQIAEQKRMWTQIIADQNQRVEYFVRTLGNKHEASVRVIEREKTLGTCMGAAPWPLETIYATRSPNGKVFVDGKLVGTIPDPIPGFISTSSGGRDATPGSGSYGGGSYDYTPGIQSGQLSNIGASYLKTGMGGEYGGAGTPGGYSNSQRGSSNNQGGRGGRLVPDKAVVPAATNKVTATKATKKPGASNDLAAGLANLKLAPSHSPGSAKAKPLSPVANGASGSAALAKKIPPEASKGAASGSAKVSAAGSSASSSKKIRP